MTATSQKYCISDFWFRIWLIKCFASATKDNFCNIYLLNTFISCLWKWANKTIMKLKSISNVVCIQYCYHFECKNTPLYLCITYAKRLTVIQSSISCKKYIQCLFKMDWNTNTTFTKLTCLHCCQHNHGNIN